MTLTSYDLAGPDPNPMTHAEVDALKSLVVDLQPTPVIINIGAERGTSTLAILEERPDAVIFSIDVAPCEAEMENVIKAGLDRDRVIRILGPSQKVGRIWKFAVDMVHVDGDHSYRGVYNDIEVWGKWVLRGGVFSFHDYFVGDPPAHNPSGAGAAVRELVEMNPIFEEVLFVDRLKAFRRPHLSVSVPSLDRYGRKEVVG